MKGFSSNCVALRATYERSPKKVHIKRWLLVRARPFQDFPHLDHQNAAQFLTPFDARRWQKNKSILAEARASDFFVFLANACSDMTKIFVHPPQHTEFESSSTEIGAKWSWTPTPSPPVIFTRLEGVWRWGLTSTILQIKYFVLSFAMEKCTPTNA